MSTERKQVLQLLTDGKISADDADRLLDRLGNEPEGVTKMSQAANAALPKFMCVHIDSTEGDVVDVRVPIGLLRSGMKLTAMLPKEAAEAVSKSGFDFSQLGVLSNAEFIGALKQMSVDVAAAGGERVRVYCE